MESLYSMTERYNNILELVTSPDVSDEDIAMALDEVALSITSKCQNGIALMQNIKQFINGADEEIKRLQKLKKHMNKRLETIEGVYIRGLKAINQPSVMTSLGTMKVKKNPAELIVDDEYIIPRKFIKQTITETVDKVTIKAALKNGQKVDGCHLEQSERLSY